MRALLVSGYAGEPVRMTDGRVVRLQLTAEQSAVVEPAVAEALGWLNSGGRDAVLIHGRARGVDEVADRMASEHAPACGVVRMPAAWKQHGRRAGYLRNEAMLQVLWQLRDCGYECRVLCLPGPKSRGTRHMERIAREAEFVVTVKELP